MSAADQAKFQKDFEAKIAKYEDSKTTNRLAALDLEKQRDVSKANASTASLHGGGMGMATAIFQISIAMGSICLVTKKKWLWYVALLLAVAASGKMILVWLT